MSEFYKTITSYFFWANFMLMVSYLLESTAFSGGGLIAYAVRLPFIGIIWSNSYTSINKKTVIFIC
jgi:hypothetical protein